MTEKSDSSEKRSGISDRLSSELSWLAATGYPVQLGPGVYEPSVPIDHSFEPQRDAEPGTKMRFIHYVAHEDGTWDVTFDEA